jgi:hypothetical protein
MKHARWKTWLFICDAIWLPVLDKLYLDSTSLPYLMQEKPHLYPQVRESNVNHILVLVQMLWFFPDVPDLNSSLEGAHHFP